MLFWIVAALLTLVASTAILLPLVRQPSAPPSGAKHDIEVYRDQLAELDRDAARGLVSTLEAEQMRAEIARRILQLGNSGRGSVVPRLSDTGIVRWTEMVSVLAVPLISWGVYGFVGSPGLPSQPLQERLAKSPAESSIDELVARAERHLAANPSDAKGWDVLAPIYLRIGRHGESVMAFRNAIRLDGATAARESGLGEAIAAEAGGTVSVDAQAAFERALEFDPGNPKARFFLATAHAQEGRVADAAVAWQAMLADMSADSPWRDVVEQALAEAAERVAGAPPESAEPNPSREDIDAAAEMTPADRNAMIETMVVQLDGRLRANPQDLEGWKRLVRSYIVLGRAADARQALGRGVSALGAQTGTARELEAFAASLGLSRTE
jgi:cytochrome c-type biogenesis protein CcmH